MKEPRRNVQTETLASFLLGIPSMVLAGGGIILMVSYWLHFPIGPTSFYSIETQAIEGRVRPLERIVPTLDFFWVLVAGTVWGALGMYFSRRREQSAPTAAAGLIGCLTAFILAWIWMLSLSRG